MFELRRTARTTECGQRVQQRRRARDGGGRGARKRKKGRRPFRSPIYGGDSGAVSNFPAHDLHDRGWDLVCAASHVALSGASDPATPRATRPQRLDSGSAAAPGAGTQATACSRRSTRVHLCSDETSGGPQHTLSNSSGSQRARSTEDVLSGYRLRLPVNTVSVRRSQERSVSAGKRRVMSCVLGRWLVFKADPAHHPKSPRSTSFGD